MCVVCVFFPFGKAWIYVVSHVLSKNTYTVNAVANTVTNTITYIYIKCMCTYTSGTIFPSIFLKNPEPKNESNNREPTHPDSGRSLKNIRVWRGHINYKSTFMRFNYKRPCFSGNLLPPSKVHITKDHHTSTLPDTSLGDLKPHRPVVANHPTAARLV